MKYITLITIFSLFAINSFAQERVLKKQQPSMMQLMLFEIKLNPKDTSFASVDFSHLPIKGYPFFTADYSQEFYNAAQRDSIIRKVDAMFFEE